MRKALASAETKFSGSVASNIPCGGKGEICRGSDRMSGKYHDYSKCYAAWLNEWRQRVENSPEDFNPLLVAEIGILKGSGLAIWSDLFGCDAQIHGFDRYLQNTVDNMGFMKSRGAFAKDNLHLHKMEQMNDNSAMIQEIANGRRFAFVIDDGYHTLESIWKTFGSFKPSLHQNFLYIIEDVLQGQISKVEETFAKEGLYDINACGPRILAIRPKPVEKRAKLNAEEEVARTLSTSNFSCSKRTNKHDLFNYEWKLGLSKTVPRAWDFGNFMILMHTILLLQT